MRGHLEKRYGSSWTLIVELGRDPYTGKRRRIARGFKGNKRQAERLLVEMMQKIEAEGSSGSGRMTVGQWLLRWFEMHKSSLGPYTQDKYEQAIKDRLIPGLGHIRLKALGALHLREFYEQTREERHQKNMTGPLASGTLRMYHAIMRACLNEAVELHLLERNPAQIRGPKLSQTKPEPLDPSQVPAVINATRGTEFYHPALLAMGTAMGISEVYGLRWCDVDLNRRIVVVNQVVSYSKATGVFVKSPKTERRRRLITLPASTVEMLGEWREDCREHGLPTEGQAFVFPGPNGRPRNPRQASGAFSALMRKHGLKKVTFHRLRHTHASLLISLGVPAKVIQERLGHSSIAVTMDFYGHLITGMQEEAAARIDPVIRDEGPEWHRFANGDGLEAVARSRCRDDEPLGDKTPTTWGH